MVPKEPRSKEHLRFPSQARLSQPPVNSATHCISLNQMDPSDLNSPLCVDTWTLLAAHEHSRTHLLSSASARPNPRLLAKGHLHSEKHTSQRKIPETDEEGSSPPTGCGTSSEESGGGGSGCESESGPQLPESLGSCCPQGTSHASV